MSKRMEKSEACDGGIGDAERNSSGQIWALVSSGKESDLRFCPDREHMNQVIVKEQQPLCCAEVTSDCWVMLRNRTSPSAGRDEGERASAAGKNVRVSHSCR